MFPKQTQLQNRTLAIHVPTASSPCETFRPAMLLLNTVSSMVPDVLSGEKTMPGFISSKAIIPVSPMTVERTKPDLERSTRYHRKGFTSASVSET